MKHKYDGVYRTPLGHIIFVQWHKTLIDSYYVVWKKTMQCDYFYSAVAIGRQIHEENWEKIEEMDDCIKRRHYGGYN